MIEITKEELEKRKALLAKKESERTLRQKNEWLFLESGYGRSNVYNNRGKK